MSPTEKQTFYKTLLRLAIPVTLQNTITSSLNLVDTVMIGQLGAIEIAAVGLANRTFFVFYLISFAICGGVAIFTAQYWGKKDLDQIGKVMAIGLVFNLALAMIFTIGTLIMPNTIMSVFTTDTAVIDPGGLYLVITAFCYLPVAATMLFSAVLRSTQNVLIPMYASTTALALNTCLNYCLILGHFGFPALGVKGAAIATLISRFVEITFILTITYAKGYPALKWSDMKGIPRNLVKRFIEMTSPIVANEFFWVMGFTIYAIVFGRMGTAEIAAVNIVKPFEEISFSVFIGLASAASVMIGNQIGAGNENMAHQHAKRIAVIGPVGALGFGAVIALTAPYIVQVFNVTPEVLDDASKLIFVLGVVLWIRIFNMINIVGVFRAGGDTKFAFLVEASSIWLVGVPLAFLGGFYWKLPVYWVFALINLEEVFKLIICVFRLRSTRWIHNLVSTPTVKTLKYEKGRDSNPI